MEDFRKRKIKYLDKLISNATVVAKITFPGTDEEVEKAKEIFFDPKDENELQLAEVIFSTLSDTYYLIQSIMNEDVKKIPLEENKGINLYIEIMKAMSEGKDHNQIVNAHKHESASIVYSFTVGMISGIDDTLTYMLEKLGLDPSSEDDIDKLMDGINELNSKFQVGNPELSSKTFNDPKTLEDAKKFAEEFHKLCEEGKTKEHKLCLECDLYK